MTTNPREQLCHRLQQLQDCTQERETMQNEVAQIDARLQEISNTQIPQPRSFWQHVLIRFKMWTKYFLAIAAILLFFAPKSYLEVVGFPHQPLLFGAIIVLILGLLLFFSYLLNKKRNEKIARNAKNLISQLQNEYNSRVALKTQLNEHLRINQSRLQIMIADDFYPSTQLNVQAINAVRLYIRDHRANSVTEALNLYAFEQQQQRRDAEQRAHNAAIRQQQAAHNAAVEREQRQAHKRAIYQQSMDSMMTRWTIEDAFRKR